MVAAPAALLEVLGDALVPVADLGGHERLLVEHRLAPRPDLGE
jgi:hypothetical protein